MTETCSSATRCFVKRICELSLTKRDGTVGCRGQLIVNKKALTLSLLLMGYLTIPQFIFVYFNQSSIATGLVGISSALLLFYAVRGKYSIGKIQASFLIISFLSIIVSNLVLFDRNINRQIFSLLALAIIFVSTNNIFRDIFSLYDKNLKFVIKISFYLLLVLGVAGQMNLFNFGNYARCYRPVFPFAEPSHFALTFGPIACAYMMQINKKRRVFIPLLMLVLAVLYPNFTILISAFLLFSIIVSIRTLVILTVLGLVFVLGTSPNFNNKINLPYFVERVRVTQDNRNLSMLVFMQGWEQAMIANNETSWLGVGFQSFGTEPPGYYATLIRQCYDVEPNRKDGCTLGTKWVGEFGVVGIFTMVLMIIGSFKSFLMLRVVSKNPLGNEGYSRVVLHSVIYIFVVEFIFRGISYFNPILYLYFYAANKIWLGQPKRGLCNVSDGG